MTLIITALSDQTIVQVSDRRLTTADGSFLDDSAIKAVCVKCADSHFCLGYSGLARVGDHRIDEWIVEILASVRVSAKTFPEVVEVLRREASCLSRRCRHLGRARALSLVMAGFGPLGPYAALLSDFEDNTGSWLSDIDDDLRLRIFYRNKKPLRKLDLILTGAEGAGDVCDAALAKVRKRYLAMNYDRTANLLVELVRKYSRHPRVGRSIGRDCLSVAVLPDGSFVCNDHPESESPRHHMAHAILPCGVYTNMEIWTGSSPPPWWTEQRGK